MSDDSAVKVKINIELWHQRPRQIGSISWLLVWKFNNLTCTFCFNLSWLYDGDRLCGSSCKILKMMLVRVCDFSTFNHCRECALAFGSSALLSKHFYYDPHT